MTPEELAILAAAVAAPGNERERLLVAMLKRCSFALGEIGGQCQHFGELLLGIEEVLSRHAPCVDDMLAISPGAQP